VSTVPINKIDLKVGLEIHQQLDTNKKLFCNCSPIESSEYTSKFSRRLRASKSELGEYDPAAIFESSKSQTIVYYLNPESSCLVEKDEEPPHQLDNDSKRIALIIATSLDSRVFTEIYPMRKIVVDGSNTSGFQRTMLVSQGGFLKVNNKRIGVQTICLEEDAAKLLGDEDSVRKYGLDRLGIPLVEVALEPVNGTPSEIKKIAHTLGKLLRSTKQVIRGLGSIRQDVNVSILGGSVVEVKGVQQLDQLEKAVEYEAKRQYGLKLISEKLNEKSLKISREKDVFDITKTLSDCKSKIIQKALKDNFLIKAIRIEKFRGMFSYSPYEGIRLGKELAQLVRFFGIGGIFHSDELPNYGIEIIDVEKIKQHMKIGVDDSFLIVAAPESKINFVVDSLINRINEAEKGVPAETRLATQDGETIYLRPRPGASRMYPETDIPPIIVTEAELSLAKKEVPKPWDEAVLEIEKKYKLNHQLAEQIFDSEYFDLFEEICTNEKNSPTFVASTLCSTLTNLQRQGLDLTLLQAPQIKYCFNLLSDAKISKESIEMVFENIMSGKSKTVDEAIKHASIMRIDERRLTEILDEIIQNNKQLIENLGERAENPLMGVAMKSLRGKVSGEIVSKILKKKVQDILNKKN